MASCDRISTCALFKQFSIKASLIVWTTRYCENDFGRCERLKLANAGLPVPVNLLPNGKMLGVPLEQATPKDAGTV
jgi:hypothetical protein